MLSDADVELLAHGRHADPFGVLGLHRRRGSSRSDAGGGWWLAAVLPGATAVRALAASGRSLGHLDCRHAAGGVFERRIARSGPYRLDVTWADGSRAVVDDPYRFGPLLGELDVWLLAEGSHLRPCDVLGATPRTHGGAAGTGFAVWAPNAVRVSVVGDFNRWDGRRHPMRLRRDCGVWEIFLPGVAAGARYKFELLAADGRLLPLKADPFARQAELRPATASIVAELPPLVAPSAQRGAANAHGAPVSIYEVHPASWRRRSADGERWLTWDELAAELVLYAADLGFTHIELMPVSEYPFDGSWGYQPIGLYAPTARFGSPDGMRRFVAAAHAAGIGVLVDWVPAHFPSDAHGLALFDGTHLYEHADPREGFHNDWNTLIYNVGRAEVRNFLVGNALYWLERYDVDGLRVDAVASMLYRDYSRKAGEWLPNVHGGRENLEAIGLLRRTNDVVRAERPQAVTLAEESTAFPGVTRPTATGGLGFHYKWNMGWMHDTLQYMARDPAHRRWHHGEITFALVYAFDEHFVLPLSHDEVVHGKRSLLGRMPGDRWQRFANLRAYYGFMWGHPGKKLLFMGCEFGQVDEWRHDAALDWPLLADDAHAGVQRLVRDLNRLYAAQPALHTLDCSASGFEWVDHDDAARSLLAFVRNGSGGERVLVVCNFTPAVHPGVRFGVPAAGNWREALNTDSAFYGGSNVGTPLGAAASESVASHGRPQSIVIDVPPLATVFFAWEAA